MDWRQTPALPLSDHAWTTNYCPCMESEEQQSLITLDIKVQNNFIPLKNILSMYRHTCTYNIIGYITYNSLRINNHIHNIPTVFGFTSGVLWWHWREIKCYVQTKQHNFRLYIGGVVSDSLSPPLSWLSWSCSLSSLFCICFNCCFKSFNWMGGGRGGGRRGGYTLIIQRVWMCILLYTNKICPF